MNGYGPMSAMGYGMGGMGMGLGMAGMGGYGVSLLPSSFRGLRSDQGGISGYQHGVRGREADTGADALLELLCWR